MVFYQRKYACSIEICSQLGVHLTFIMEYVCQISLMIKPAKHPHPLHKTEKLFHFSNKEAAFQHYFARRRLLNVQFLLFILIDTYGY